MADFVMHQSWLILALPFLSFVLGMLCCKRPAWSAGIAILCNAIAMMLAVTLTVCYAGLGKTVVSDAWRFQWLPLLDGPGLHIGFYLDQISVMMLCVITIISTLVHCYSVGYMRDDDSRGRFFPLLSFFVFSMIGLVAATSIIQMFIFWELVGVSSYMLIGFWYHKPAAVAASKKAFIITRFADAFFLLGILLLGLHASAYEFSDLLSAETLTSLEQDETSFAGLSMLSLATLCIFIGGWGKSAMFPLHVWLPDAMEGPTPVSSIIHSATMVVAGIFLTARMFPLFEQAPLTMTVVEFTGAFTALFAAIIACTQMDIKRILAFSTLSQLGYMMFSLGLNSDLGYSASMFHVFTHAFFKCLLFLSAGLVIHAVHSNDIAHMGGLRKKLTGTWIVTGLACLAIAGFPMLSGFFSKDEILIAAYEGGHWCSFVIGAAVGGITAFYMFRYFFLIFHGSYRGDVEHLAHAHEDKWMLVPMLLLAVPTVCAGVLAKPLFLDHVLPPGASAGEHHAPLWIPVMASVIAILGILLALVLYGRRTPDLADEAKGLRKVIMQKFYIDEVYSYLTHAVIFRWIAAPLKWFDDHVVDGLINVQERIAQHFAAKARSVQNGLLHIYIGVLMMGFILLILFGGLFN